MILVVDCGSSKTENFRQIFAEYGYKSEVIKPVDLKELDKYKGVVISGGPLLLTKESSKSYLDYFDFIVKYPKPILGICLGHQIIGIKYGAKIYHGDEIRRMQKITLIKSDFIFSGIENYSNFKEDHVEYIDLPDNFVHLAKSETCFNEVMKHKDKSIYGMQFHPEISNDAGKRLLKNFAKLCFMR